MKIETQLIHAGKVEHSSGAVVEPIVLATSFEREGDQLSYRDGFLYSRYDNPNRRSLETKLALLEGGVAACAFSSGLAAATAIFQTLKTGDHVVVPDDIYFGVRLILQKHFAQFGISVSVADFSDPRAVAAAMTRKTRLVWIETPSNPRIKITDLAAVAALARKKGCLAVADNTFATPFHQNPLALGIDVVMHSTTKYLAGHSDILGGALIFREKNELFETVRAFQKNGGSAPSPFDCWLLSRSLATFQLRMPVHSANAMRLATFLEGHEKVEKVFYAGLKNDAGHRVAKKQMQKGFGGTLSILVKGGRAEALEACKKLQIFTHATSLGGVESLVEHRRSVEWAGSTTPENLLRISVGIENIEDLIADFEQALS